VNQLLLESLAALGQLAMKEAGAAGYGLYLLYRESGALIPLQTCGTQVTESGLSADLASGVSFPARVAGMATHVLTFVFRSATISENAVKDLDQMARVVEGVLQLSLLPAQYAELAAHAAELEAQLVCLKIRDRARGLIKNPTGDGFGTEALTRFSGAILRPSETATMLGQVARERYQEVQQRSLTAQAKAVLESVYGMSEEQAHHHLRITSRKSRRPLQEVALEYIGKRS
jgi:hypothetical protein